MGEYAMYGDARVKIGTCEDMYYLRADQRYRVGPLEGNVNPTNARDLEVIRFRFPWPDEDHIEPGAFERYDRVLGLYGVEVPADLEHGRVQFVAHAGYNVMLPCPESAEAKASGLSFARNGHPGPVQFGQQGFRNGLWVLIAGDRQTGSPTLDHVPVPALGPNQAAEIPPAWIENRHRGGLN